MRVKYSSLLHRFKREDDGAIAILFALMAIPVMCVAGGAMDMSAVMQAEAAAQANIDMAANTAVVALRSGKSDQEVKQTARSVLIAQDAKGSLGNTYEIRVNRKKRSVGITASGSKKTAFLSIIGFKEFNYKAHTLKFHNGRLRLAEENPPEQPASSPVQVTVNARPDELTNEQIRILTLVQAIQAGDHSRLDELYAALEAAGAFR